MASTASAKCAGQLIVTSVNRRRISVVAAMFILPVEVTKWLKDYLEGLEASGDICSPLSLCAPAALHRFPTHCGSCRSFLGDEIKKCPRAPSGPLVGRSKPTTSRVFAVWCECGQAVNYKRLCIVRIGGR